MTTNMNFGPEWMRGTTSKRSNTLESQTLRPAMHAVGHSGSGNIYGQTHNSLAHSEQSSVPHPSNQGLGDQTNTQSSSTLETPTAEGLVDSSNNPYKYSKDFMLSLYRPMEMPADFERHEYVAVEESQGPLSFVDLTEEEKKLLAGPVHSEGGRRIINSNNDRPNSNNQRNNNHRDMYGSPMNSPASENTPGTPNRMNMSRSKGRMHDYFSRERDGHIKRYDHDGSTRQREWSQSEGFGAPSPNKPRDEDQEEPSWGGANRETVGSFDSNGVFRLGGAVTGHNVLPEDPKSHREWQGDVDLSANKEMRGRNFRTQGDDMLRDTFNAHSANPLRNAGFSDRASVLNGGLDASLGSATSFSTDLNVGNSMLTGAKPQSLQYKWLYRDPQGNVQGPFDAQEMQDWYKAGFFAPTLLVRREDEPQFEPLIALIRRVGNEEEPFLTTYPSSQSLSDSPGGGGHGMLNMGLPLRPRSLDPFSRSSSSSSTLLGGSTPLDPTGGSLFRSTSQPSDLLSPQAGGPDFNQKYSTLGGLSSNFLQQKMGQNPATPGSPSRFQGSFNSFGSSLLGSRDTSSPWSEKPRAPAWLSSNQTDLFSNPDSSTMPSLLQRQQQQSFNPLFGAGTTSPSLFEYHRLMNEQLGQHQQYIQMLQQKQQQHLQFQQQLQQQLSQQASLEAMLSTQQRSPFITPDAYPPQNQGMQPTLGSPAHHATSPAQTNVGLSVSSPMSTLGWPSSTEQTGEKDAPATPLSGQNTADDIDRRKIGRPEGLANNESQNTATDNVTERLSSMNISEAENVEASSETSPKGSAPSAPSPEAASRPANAARPVSLREIQAEELRKQQEAKQQQTKATQSNGSATTSAPSSTKTGWNVPSGSPWGRETPSKGPSLREIQEMEAKEAEARKQAAESNQSAVANDHLAGTSANLSWGVVVPNKGTPSKSSSTSSPVWGTTTAPKKTLREIQQEEEEALKKAKAAQQASVTSMASSISASNLSPAGKGYAGVVGNSVSKAPSSGSGWTTVTSQRSAAKVPASSTTPAANASSASSATRPSSQQQNAWEVAGAPKHTTAAPVSAPSSTASSRTATSNAGSGRNNKADNENKPPSEEFCRWCRHSLRGLNAGVNADEIMQMLLAFPLDNSSAEIIQDIIYANSTSMDGRRFAEEFMKRRRADLAGKLSVTIPMSSASLEDESTFKVVTKKGKKKTQA